MRVWGALCLAISGCGTVPDVTSDPVGEGDHVAVEIVGTVRDPDGQAVAGAWVISAPRGFEAMTDAAGAYRLEGLPAGSYSVVGAASGFAASSSLSMTLGDGDVGELDVQLEVSAAVGVELEVAVEGPDGPLEGATVTAVGQVVLTDAAGIAMLSGLAEGPIDVVIQHPLTWDRTVSGADPTVVGPVLSIAVSARPPAGSVEVGDTLCVICHTEQGATHAASRHGRAAPLESSAPDAAFAAGWMVDLGAGATATLQDGPGGHEVVLTGSDATARFLSVDGWIGDPAHSAVPWTQVDGRAQPLPVVWVALDAKRAVLAEAQDRIAPFETGRWVDGGGLVSDPTPRDAAEASCLPCHVTGFEPTVAADGTTDLETTWEFGVDPRFASAGVGCERCHGPGSAHVAASLADKRWTITRPDRLDRARTADVCAQCHGAVHGVDAPVSWPWSETLGRFEPGLDLADFADSGPVSWDNGTASRPAQQADEVLLSSHADPTMGIGCLDCHDPHSGGPIDTPALRAPSADNGLCLGCHLGLSFEDDDGLVVAHSGHLAYAPGDPAGQGRCTGCHMPRTSSWTDFGSQTGAGRVASHAFIAPPPSDAIAVFDAQGTANLAPGLFPPYGCVDCHAGAEQLATDAGDLFLGPYGDPSLRTTHVAFQTWYDVFFP